MNFTFLHVADLHLGSPFKGLSSRSSELASLVTTASREAMEDLVTKALDFKVDFVVIAGDVYDGDWKDTSIGHFFNRQMSRLHRADVPVYLLRGNHDAVSVITKAVTLPPNVHEFSARKVSRFEIPALKVVLLGRSFGNRAENENLAITYPAAVPGWFNIGVLHTSLNGRPNHDNYAPCSLDDLRQRGYDYWALGHVHEFEELARNPHIIYPGNLQGRSVRECGPKGAVWVSVQDGEVKEVARLPLERIRWESLTTDLSHCTDNAEVFEALLVAIRAGFEGAQETPLVFRMTLTGVTRLHRELLADSAAVADEVLAAAQQISERAWVESVKIETTEPLGQLHGDGQNPLSTVDLEAMLDPLLDSPGVRGEAVAALGEIRRRLPSMEIPETMFSQEGVSVLLLEARAWLLDASKKVGQA